MRLLLIVLAAFLSMTSAQANTVDNNRRVALVIGNSAYRHATPLANPADDAKLMAATLRHAGFEVVDGIDLTYSGMNDALNRFAESSYNAEVALIYYAGHGMQVNGKNYLVPVDAELTQPAHLKTRTIEIDDFLAAMPPDPAVGVVILDACRDNPLSRSLATFFPQSRSNGLVGLAPVEVKPADTGTGGLLIAYATDPGAVAFDGKGANSPYTSALVKYLAAPGVELQSALTRVRGDVTSATNGRQRPWHNASLGREVFLGGEVVQAAAPAPATGGEPAVAPQAKAGPSPWEIEQRVWDEASRRNTIAHYEAYLRQFPNGVFTQLAALNMEQLKQAPPNVANLPEPAARSTGAAAAAKAAEAVTSGDVDKTGVPAKTALAEPPAASAPAATNPAATNAAAPGAAAPPADATGASPDIGTELTEAGLGLTYADRIDLQLRLRALGRGAGRVDGAFGAGTRQAIGDWQAANGLSRTTYFTRSQVDELVEETAPLIEAERTKYDAEQAQAAGKAKTDQAQAAGKAKAEPAKPAKRIEASRPVKRVERSSERRKAVRQAQGVQKRAQKQAQKKFRTCSNVWGSFQVPADKRCPFGGADTQYMPPQ